MALRCLRLAKAGGLCNGLQPRPVEPVVLQKRFMREKNPDDSNVFGTLFQSENYKPRHPRNTGIVPYVRIISAIFGVVALTLSVSLVASRFVWMCYFLTSLKINLIFIPTYKN